jgi:Fur family transcriptional regulator, peroxide stress response regulator
MPAGVLSVWTLFSSLPKMNSMNMFHREPASGTLDDAALRRALEQAGWRFTRQRAAVFAYLHAAQCHPTAEQVFAAVRQHITNISLATVYKALEALVDVHLAHRIAGDSGPTRYDGRSEPHYHLRCQHTGQVIDLPLPYDPTLLDKLDPHLVEMLRQQGFEITGHRLELVGRFVCPDKMN